MILRALFALVSLAILGALLYVQRQDGAASETAPSDSLNAEPGYVATHAVMIETGEDGRPLYQLTADRIAQPAPQGTIFLTSPKLEYQPEAGNRWTMTAQQGELPQAARTADLSGNVHAEGIPTGSRERMRIDTEVLHLDMEQQLATTNADVRVDWGGNVLRGRGMRADLKNDHLELAGDVRGVISH